MLVGWPQWGYRSKLEPCCQRLMLLDRKWRGVLPTGVKQNPDHDDEYCWNLLVHKIPINPPIGETKVDLCNKENATVEPISHVKNDQFPYWDGLVCQLKWGLYHAHQPDSNWGRQVWKERETVPPWLHKWKAIPYNISTNVCSFCKTLWPLNRTWAGTAKCHRHTRIQSIKGPPTGHNICSDNCIRKRTAPKNQTFLQLR